MIISLLRIDRKRSIGDKVKNNPKNFKYKMPIELKLASAARISSCRFLRASASGAPHRPHQRCLYRGRDAVNDDDARTPASGGGGAGRVRVARRVDVVPVVRHPDVALCIHTQPAGTVYSAPANLSMSVKTLFLLKQRAGQPRQILHETLCCRSPAPGIRIELH